VTWHPKKIAEIGQVVTGKTPPTNQAEYFDGDYLFITPTDLDYSNYYVRAAERTVTDVAKDALPNQFVPENAVMFTCIGATVGKCGISPSECLTNQQINSVIANEEHDSKFIYYLLCNNVDFIRRLGGGSATPIISKSKFEEVELLVPELPIQRRIANILSTYDDLIENNRRRMELLEETARQIYREWFVRLRFPGREHTRIINGVPEGWERKTLAQLCESIDYGYTASAEQEEVGPKFLRITDIVPSFIDWSLVPYCQIEDDKLSKFRLNEGDIVIARTGATVGYAKRIHKRHPDAVFASYLVRLRRKQEIDNLIVGIFAESEDYKDYVKSRVGGAAQPNANAKVLAGAEILVPPMTLQRTFCEFVEPLIDQRELLQFQNEKLRAARDLLLPRLMSGEIAV
jgi:type I restriction enzyme S subunit